MVRMELQKEKEQIPVSLIIGTKGVMGRVIQSAREGLLNIDGFSDSSCTLSYHIRDFLGTNSKLQAA